MARKRILFDASPMIDSNKTGVGYYVSHLMNALGAADSSGVNFTGYYFDLFNRSKKKSPRIENVAFYKIWFMPGKILSMCRRLGFQPFLELFIGRKADLILSTNYVALPTLRKTKKALIIYDLGFLDCPEFLQDKNLQFLKRFCSPSIQKADLIITISAFTKHRIQHYFPHIKATIIITPIPPQATIRQQSTLPRKLTKLGIQKQRYLLYVGTLEPRKNLITLLGAYESLPKTTRDSYALVLVGGHGWKDDDIVTSIQDKQEAGMNIITTGYVTDDERTGLYNYATAAVLPSHYEGFGMPILEAMQHNVAVAVSNIPVFHEVAGNAVLYFNKDVVSDMASKLDQILTNKELRQQLIQRGHKRLEDFSWQKNAALVLDAFNGIDID